MDVISTMDCREILTECFNVPAQEMKGDNLNEIFTNLRSNGNKHIVDGLIILFERYAEEKARINGETIHNSRDIFDRIKLKFVGKMQEEFHALYLDNKHRIIESRMITKGTLNQSLVHPRECFSPALEMRAAAVIFVHDHPSGDPKPSQQDIQITKRLQEVGDLVGIKRDCQLNFCSLNFAYYRSNYLVLNYTQFTCTRTLNSASFSLYNLRISRLFGRILWKNRYSDSKDVINTPIEPKFLKPLIGRYLCFIGT